MRARWLAKFLLPRLVELSKRREPDFQITRGSDKEVYLRRWWVIPRNRFFNVYLHNMLRDDDAVLHDHMYVSLSLVLTDGLEEVWCRNPANRRYREHHYDYSRGDVYDYLTQRRTVCGGDLVWRSSRMAHQLIVRQEAWTLFVTGPRIKEWGFWCPRGFRHWSKYVASGQDSSGGTSGMGTGCGEQS